MNMAWALVCGKKTRKIILKSYIQIMQKLIISSVNYILGEFGGWPSSKQTRSFSLSMQQLIAPLTGCRMLSHPFCWSPAGALIQKLNPSNSFIPSDAVINNWFKHEINELWSHSYTGNGKINEGFNGASANDSETLYSFSMSTTTSFFSSCIGNLHFNILLILDGFSIILGDFSSFYTVDVMSVPSLGAVPTFSTSFSLGWTAETDFFT